MPGSRDPYVGKDSKSNDKHSEPVTRSPLDAPAGDIESHDGSLKALNQVIVANSTAALPESSRREYSTVAIYKD